MEESGIREDMEVLDSDGSRVGIVDGVEGGRIKLTRKDSPDGEHHYVSLDSVERVDEHVHLSAGASTD